MTFPNSLKTFRKFNKTFFHSVLGDLEGTGIFNPPPYSSYIQKPPTIRVMGWMSLAQSSSLNKTNIPVIPIQSWGYCYLWFGPILEKYSSQYPPINPLLCRGLIFWLFHKVLWWPKRLNLSNFPSKVCQLRDDHYCVISTNENSGLEKLVQSQSRKINIAQPSS